MDSYRYRRLDGLYRNRVLLIWDTWRSSKARKIVIVLGLIFAIVTSGYYHFGESPTTHAIGSSYTGKQTKTIEYVIGGDASDTATSDNTSRASGTRVYAGTSWSTSATTVANCSVGAGCKNVVIAGSGIKVLQAYVDLRFHHTGGNNDLTNVDVTMDVEGSVTAGSHVRLTNTKGVIWQDRGTSDLSATFTGRYDATSMYDRQSDSAFNNGLDTVVSVVHTAGTRALTSVRLVITYESYYNASQTQTKTVRFPLDSDASGDTGSTQSTCAASTACDFSYTASLPDLSASGDIKDVFVIIHAGINSSTASTLTPRHNNNGTLGTNGPGYNWVDAVAGDTNVMVYWRMTVGTNDFNPTVTTSNQKVRITMGSVAANVLGGEVVVTYNYSPSATTQVETVQYFMKQQTVATSTTKTTDNAVSVTVSNTGLSMQNIWYKVHAAPTEANTLTVYGKVGAATERSQGYTVGGSNTVRAGANQVIYFDLTGDVGSFSSATTDLDAEVEWASGTGDAPVAIEAFLTFQWSGSLGGTETRTVQYAATHGGSATVANYYYNVPITASLSETVTKTYRSSYLLTNVGNHQTSTTTFGTVIVGLNATEDSSNLTSITENPEEGTTTTGEGYQNTYLHNISSAVLSGGSTIDWTSRTFTATHSLSVGNETYSTHVMSITYDAALPYKNPRLWSSGAELNSTTADMEVTSTSGTVSISSTTVRSGNYAYRVNPTSGTGSFVKTWANSAQQGLFWARSYINIATAPGTLTSVMVLSQSTNNKVGIRMNSDRTLEFWNEEDSAQIGSDTFALNTGTWYRLEIFINNTTLSTTEATMRIDGRTVATSSSLNLAAGIDRLSWGVMTSTTADLFFDDLAINQNTENLEEYWPGEGKIVHMLPNANGDTSSWTRDPASCNGSSNNYECVDEETPNDNTDFLRSQTANQVQEVDLVNSSTVGISSGDIIKFASVGARVRVCGNATGGFACDVFGDPINYQTRIKSEASGTVLESANISILDSDSSWQTNDDDTAKLNKLTAYYQPGTVDPWTPEKLSTAQIGIANRDSGVVGFRVTALWLQVEYIALGGGRIFSSGFELNSTTAGVEWTSFTGSPTIVTSPVRSGAYALQTASGTQSFTQYHFSVSNNDGPYFVRVYLRIATLPDAEESIIELRDTTNARRAYINLNSLGALTLFDEDGQIGSASSNLSTATWYRVELQFNRNGGSSGTVEARIDGASPFATSSTRSISTGVARLAVGLNVSGLGDIGVGQIQYDDIAINTNLGTTQNSYPGEGKIIHLRPNASGDSAQWTTNGTCTGGNYGCTNEVTPNDATNYISTSTANNTDDYNLDASSLSSSDIIALVSVGVRFRANNSTTGEFRLRLKDSSNGAVSESDTTTANSTTWSTNTVAGVEPRNYQLTSYTPPGSNSDWSNTALDNAQIGVRNIDGSGQVDVSTLWLLVDYEFVAATISVSGRVFTDEGTTGLDCSTPRTIRIKVNGAGDHSASCSNSPSNGSYTVNNVTVTAAGDVITVFLDETTEKAVTVSIIANTTSNIIDFNLYQNRVIVRHEDSGPINNVNLDQYDSGNDADIQFTVTSGALTVASGAKLIVWTGKTFTPGGTVTTTAGSSPSGDVLIQSSAVLNMGGNNLSIGGSYQNSGTFTSSSNTTTFTATATGKTLGGTLTGSSAFHNLTFNGSGGGWTFSDNAEITNNFTITSGSVTAPSSLSIGGSYSNSGTFTHNSGTVIFTATATGKTLGGTLTGSSAFHNLTFNGSGGGWSNNAALSVTNDLTMTAGELSGSNDVTVNANVTGSNGTFNFSGGTFEQRSNNVSRNFGTTSGSSAWIFNDLTFSNSCFVCGGGGITFITQTGGSGGITVNGTLRVGRAADNDESILNAGNRTWTLSGTGGDPFQLISTAGGNSGLVAATSTFAYTGNNGTGDTVVQSATYNILTISNNSETYNLEGTTQGTDVTITTGTLSLNSQTLTVTNDLAVNGTLSGSTNVTVNNSLTGSGTVTLTGGIFEQRVAANANFGSSSGSNEWRFATLIFSNSSGTNRTISPNAGTGNVRVDTLLQIGRGSDTNNTTFDNNTTNDRILDINGSIEITSRGTLLASNNEVFTVGDDWTNNGTFTHNSGEVTFDSTNTARLTGATTFYKFTSVTAAKTLEFTAGQTFTIDTGGLLTLTGAADPNWLHIHSSSPGNQWLINHQGTESVSYVHVSDSGCELPSTDITTSNSFNDGNNGSCWKFDPVFSQEDYRFGQPNGLNIDYTGAPAENNPYTTGGTGDDFRLRMLIHVADTELATSGRNFKLQFGEKTGATCGNGVSWTDVSTSSGVIRYYDGAGRNDGDSLITNGGDPDHTGHTKVAQTYEEANNFTNSVAAIPAGQDGLWDFSLINHSAVGGKRYCFRAVESDNTLFANGYNQYPEVIIDEELIFTLDATSKNFGIVQPGANPTEQTSTVTVSTNSSTGYIVYAWATTKMTMVRDVDSFEIPDWTGTNASPTTWPNGSFGFGYTTDDSNLTGGTADRFTSGGAKYAGFINTGPGDPVADRSSGPVTSASNNITYRLAAGTGQQAGTYTTVIVYVVSVTF